MTTERAVQTSYVDLPSILIGTILALAISIVLAHFGSAIGLSMTPDMTWEEDTAVGKLVTLGLWFLWIQILASIAGGYVSGRMRRAVTGAPVHEREVRDGIHGLLVWATGTVLVAIGVSLVAALAALADTHPDTTERTQEIIELQKNAGIIIAFSTAATSLVSAVAAWWAATLGGEHRDENVDHSRYVSFRKRSA